jgi:exodeoxyribonuclease VII small subunit
VESKDKELTFEVALSKLEAVVESMESGEIPLDELLQKFELGNKLLKTCEVRLKDAELKIEKLKKDRAGVSFTPFKSEGETSS